MDIRFVLGSVELVENDPLLEFFENQKNQKNPKGYVHTFFWKKKLGDANRAENWDQGVSWDGEFIAGVRFSLQRSVLSQTAFF